MAGGIWKAQNKVRPGAYINVKGVPEQQTDTTTGRVLMANNVDYGWGANGVIELSGDSDFQALIGVAQTDPKAITIHEALKGAVTVLLVNDNGGAKATIADDTLPWTFTAKYAGIRGNDITVSVLKDPTDETKITVTTLLGTSIVDQQIINTDGSVSLVSNDYMTVNTIDQTSVSTKLGVLTGKTTYKLAGGTTEKGDIAALLADAMETRTYSVVTTAGYPVDNEIHALLANLVQRMRDDEGYKVTGVVPALTTDTKYNYEAVTAVVNGVTLMDGTVLDATTAAAYIAGASSALDGSASLTYTTYPDAQDATPRLSNTAIIDNLKAGHLVFSVKRDGDVVIEEDINSLVQFTDDKPSYFAKNQVIRTIDSIANMTQTIFENQFIGKVNNDDTGRDLFKANLVARLDTLQDGGSITNFVADDVTVAEGQTKDSIVVDLAVQPSEAMEKLYMTIMVQ
ncbi:phage tail sheath family protein [Lactiplantibacillus argentoratensis]|uniref:Phage tail sheath family protein n=1 Tax=Lactiplantibacillus argentoratensis TaxID=271881 RepID=A0ABS5UGN3_9LACO|nr:phage tail sheath family protein [Lactiplantibacillus argentoratensis]MBT1137708.1 phage tail sheath family protein [Lactiplantibacillus argentoratensis]MBT1140566.1 phage tail sheath family protein [Lactiplantibacillus argentoratensis]